MPTVLPGVLLVGFWSSGFVGATLATGQAAFVTVLAWRTIVAAVVVGVIAAARGERLTVGQLRTQVPLGLLVQVIYLGGVFAAAGAGVPAGTSALIAALQPLLVAAVAGRALGRAPTRRQTVGLCVGAIGVALVVAGDLGGAAAPAAFLLPVVALAGLATGTVLEARWQPRTPLLMSLAVQSAVSAVVFSAVSGATGRFVPPTSDRFWLSIGWLVLLSTLGGYGTYLFVVRRSGPTLASTLLYFTPPATALWAWLMFGQQPGRLAVPGVLVCAVGVTVFLTRSPERVPPGRVAGRDRRVEPSEKLGQGR